MSGSRVPKIAAAVVYRSCETLSGVTAGAFFRASVSHRPASGSMAARCQLSHADGWATEWGRGGGGPGPGGAA
eukprot:scaffold32_cov368-Prasinococcus_capsulatus_cf.AAC.2